MLREFISDRAVFVALAAAALFATAMSAMPAPRDLRGAPAPSGAAEATEQAAEVPLAQAYGP